MLGFSLKHFHGDSSPTTFIEHIKLINQGLLFVAILESNEYDRTLLSHFS